MALDKNRNKSFGGICQDFIEILPMRDVDPIVHFASKVEGNVTSEEDFEKFYFIEKTGNYQENPVIVNGAEMFESQITMLINGDTHDQLRELNRIRKKKWVIRFSDQNHNTKILGGYDGAYASMRIVKRDNKTIRPERNDIEVQWRCVHRSPVIQDL